MWKLLTYVTCVVILIPNAYGYGDYTSYLLSRLNEHMNQVNQLLKMIYKQRAGVDPSGADYIGHDYTYDNILWQTLAVMQNTYQLLMKHKTDRLPTPYTDIIPYPDNIRAVEVDYDLDRTMGFKPSGRRSAQPDWSNNFYEALAAAFKNFLSDNPDVRTQLGEDFNADALINPPDPPSSETN